MSTDTIREKSTAALAEALRRHRTNTDSPVDESDIRQTQDVLAASPTLARRLDLGTAWDEAEAPLPKGALTMNLTAMGGMPFVAEAWNVLTFAKVAECFGPTPTDALLALAEKLKEATR